MQAISENLGIYIHVPFCAKSCAYCRFYKRIPSLTDIEKYVDCVETEVDLLRLENAGTLPRADTVFWGGGTPSSLSEKAIQRLAKITNSADAREEWTVEVAPTALTKSKLDLLKELGVTRISMGVQSFNQKTLDTLGRTHSLHTTRNAIEMIAEKNFKHFSIDLIFGAAGQSDEEWLADLREAAAQPVDHISAYCLESENATSACVGKVSQDKLVKEQREIQLSKIAINTLPELGFRQYEISNFSKPKCECLHNLSTWNMAQWIGLGPSAASQWKGVRRRNPADLNVWAQAIENRFPIYEDIVKLDENELFECAIIFGLRMNVGVNLSELQTRYPRANAKKYIDIADALVKKGVLIRENSTIRLTDDSRLIADAVALEFV